MDPLRFGHVIAAVKQMLREDISACFDSGQFAVSRERIHLHPRPFYQELLDWARDAQTRADEEAIRCTMLENNWHMIFGETAICPPNKDSCAIAYGLDQ
jgi:hypothetical protein